MATRYLVVEDLLAIATRIGRGEPGVRDLGLLESAAARPRTKAAAEAKPAVRTVTQEEIRVRAYFLSLEHAGHGHDADFWLMAERELAQGHERGE